MDLVSLVLSFNFFYIFSSDFLKKPRLGHNTSLPGPASDFDGICWYTVSNVVEKSVPLTRYWLVNLRTNYPIRGWAKVDKLPFRSRNHSFPSNGYGHFSLHTREITRKKLLALLTTGV